MAADARVAFGTPPGKSARLTWLYEQVAASNAPAAGRWLTTGPSAAPWPSSRSSIPPRRRSSCPVSPNTRATTRNRWPLALLRPGRRLRPDGRHRQYPAGHHLRHRPPGRGGGTPRPARPCHRRQRRDVDRGRYPPQHHQAAGAGPAAGGHRAPERVDPPACGRAHCQRTAYRCRLDPGLVVRSGQ